MAESPFNRRPVGAGPYRLLELTADHAIFESNNAYHAGAPYIQRLEVRFFHDDQAMLAALNGGELDGAYFSTGLSDTDQLGLERQSSLRLHRLDTGSLTYVFLNLNDPLFQDRRVRQALLYALDRDRLAGLVYGELAAAADSPLPAGIWSEAAALSRYATDARTAGLLLDEAGWRLNGAGERQRGAERLRFDLMTSPDPVYVAVANDIAAQWKQVGVVAQVVVKGGTELTRDILGPRAQQTRTPTTSGTAMRRG
jgi:peptide/nickel transport system substrate-binding protein